MNSAHFRAFLWLRWRLFANQVARGGIVSKIILVIGGVSAAFLTVTTFIVMFCAGLFGIPEVPAQHRPLVILAVWDGLALVFLLSWSSGLLAELQRTEAFSLQKFLHLPVSLGSAFTLNYLTSLVCLTMVLIAPMMVGFSLGLMIGLGPLAIVQLPLAAAFLFMVTALSYQMQGWLASLMVNKRRRRTIIVMVTLAFILLFQAPNLFNLFMPWTRGIEREDTITKQRKELDRALTAKEISDEQYRDRITKAVEEQNARDRQLVVSLKDWAWIANMALPIGWPAWGAAAAAEENVLPAIFGTLGLTLIGVASMWRSYRTTMRLYTGQYTAGAKVPAPASAPRPTTAALPAYFLERTLPGLSEQAAVIALTGLRSLLRALEVKMLLLSPIIMIVIFGGMFLRGGMNVPAGVVPLIAYGAVAMTLFTMGQLAGNQFGYDRSGFRVFVLSPAPRREILLGKNLAFLPLVAVLSAPMIALVAIFLPMRLDHLLALPFQFVSMFLIYCMMANVLSILAPMPVASGSLKPVSPKGLPMVLHMLFVFTVPTALAPTFAPLGIEALLEALDLSFGLPICLVLTVLIAAAVVALYRLVITAEGRFLQAREQKILDVVVAKAE
ncbi:MAG: hypothetical protein EXR98_21425 [Gemmataceae bacterium]|nr:hypothetical protein [Gemmataceae bacterium]